eukprot:6392976-Amphidinium_carterae.1
MVQSTQQNTRLVHKTTAAQPHSEEKFEPWLPVQLGVPNKPAVAFPTICTFLPEGWSKTRTSDDFKVHQDPP